MAYKVVPNTNPNLVLVVPWIEYWDSPKKVWVVDDRYNHPIVAWGIDCEKLTNEPQGNVINPEADAIPICYTEMSDKWAILDLATGRVTVPWDQVYLSMDAYVKELNERETRAFEEKNAKQTRN